MKYLFMLLILLGGIGLLGDLLFIMLNETLNELQNNLAYLVAVLSMLFLACGVYGCNEVIKGRGGEL
jgi:hypothetical protein